MPIVRDLVTYCRLNILFNECPIVSCTVFYPTGVSYGEGVYFATEASYSLAFAKPTNSKGECFMFFAKVLVGKYTRGQEGIKTPPPIDPNRREVLYDSVVDSTDDPTVFVVFHDDQCYPEYLITFKHVSKK